MWYIDELHFNRDDISRMTVRVPVKYLYYDDFFRNQCSLDIRIRDSETDEEVYLDCAGTDEVLEFFAEYRPYGWCRSQRNIRHGMITVLDKPSIDFLDLVEAVELVPAIPEVRVNIGYKFGFWDEARTLVDVSSASVAHSFPLFQVVCFMKHGSYKDKFYLRYDRTMYGISFTDVHKARTMIAKAVVNGYNPLKDQIRNLPHLIRFV